jgi:hypothetical protein
MAINPLQRNAVVEKTIAGHVYKIELLGAKKGKQVIVGLSRIIGPSLEAKDKIAKFCELLTDAQLDALCETFAGQTRISPEDNPDAEFALKDVFDRHFSGHYGTLTLWLKACLEANYGDFLKELGVDAGSLLDLLSVVMQADKLNPPEGNPSTEFGAALLRASADSKK